MHGTTLSCDKGRLRPGINRKVKGSSRPNSSPGGDDLLGSFRWQDTPSTSEFQQQRFFQTAGILPAPSMSLLERAMNKRRDVSSRKKRGFRQCRRLLESSCIISHQRTRSWPYSPAEVMILSELIEANHLRHHSKRETRLAR